MKKEYLFITIIGLFLLAYLLEAIVDPLALKLATPYDYLNISIASKYPFTFASIAIRSLAITLTPLFILSFLINAHFLKAMSLLIFSVLSQLYSLQEITTGTTLLPLEWSLSLTISGLILLVPCLVNLSLHFFKQTQKKFDEVVDNLGNNESN